MKFKNKNISFSEAIKKLEEIVANLEQGGETFEESLKQFEDGVALCSKCEEELKKAKLKIEHLNASEQEEE